jgi:hypothetical protein
MTQLERLNAYLKSLDHHRPQLLMVKMGADGEPEWWSNQGYVMGTSSTTVTDARKDEPLETGS